MSFCKLICTSFNNIETTNNSTLGLRAEWIEDCPTANRMTELCLLWQVDLSEFKYPSVGSVSEILVGQMKIGCPIHIRIVRY